MEHIKVAMFWFSFMFFLWIVFALSCGQATDNYFLIWFVTWIIYVVYSSFTLFKLSHRLWIHKIYIVMHALLILAVLSFLWFHTFAQFVTDPSEFVVITWSELSEFWDYLYCPNKHYTIDELGTHLLMILFVWLSFYMYFLANKDLYINRVRTLLIVTGILYWCILFLEFERIFTAPFFAIYYALLWFYVYKRNKLSINHD